MDWIKIIRLNKGMTQESVAKKIGVSRQAYNHYENGVRKPSVKIAKKIGKTLGFNWTKFFEEKEVS